MNFVLVKSTRVPALNRPLRFWQLRALVNKLGLPKAYCHKTQQHIIMAGGRKCPYALYDEVVSHWKKIRRHLHPDVGGDTKRFACSNAIFIEIRDRMKREGVLT